MTYDESWHTFDELLRKTSHFGKPNYLMQDGSKAHALVLNSLKYTSVNIYWV